MPPTQSRCAFVMPPLLGGFIASGVLWWIIKGTFPIGSAALVGLALGVWLVCLVAGDHRKPAAGELQRRYERQTIRLGSGHKIHIRKPVQADVLDETVTLWLADHRPAWETVGAFERDVELILSGKGYQPISGMPLRGGWR